MKYDQVEELKRQIFEELLFRPPHPTYSAPSPSRRSRMHRKSRDELDVALGITHTEIPDEFKLAVRVDEQTYTENLGLVDQISERARGEIDLLIMDWPQAYGRPPKSTPQAQPFLPLEIGISIANQSHDAGSIGWFPKSEELQERVVLSCAHVLSHPWTDDVYQPGPYDGGTPADLIGSCISASPINFQQGINQIDAAISTLTKPYLLTSQFLPPGLTIQGVGPIPHKKTFSKPAKLVHKVGSTTGLTTGYVRAEKVDGVPVKYGRETARFNDCIEIIGSDGNPFSLEGDSGALVFDEDGFAFGLVFCGGEGRTWRHPMKTDITYANRLDIVLKHFNLTL
ncbi:TPA: hypothetical protein ACGCG0_000948 [Stenotrophomonas maltophilia]